MEKFDLEKALKGEKICTREGRAARIISTDIKSNEYPLAVAYYADGKEETVDQFTKDGFYFSTREECDFDLCMA